MPVSAGDKLGPYEILAPIGAGGMGEVWKARDARLDRIVAIKTSSEKFSERFECEARAIAALNHPNICTLYDVGPNYLVMEYLEGETLADRLARGVPPFRETAMVAIQVGEALTQAHRKGLIHRDIKPANIMLCGPKGAQAKLLDFGLAKLMAPSGDADEVATQAMTQDGAIAGTFQYMAPEQLEGKELDARTDLFAFGAVLYEMVTGRKAFEASSRAALISSILSATPVPPSTLEPSATPLLDRIISKCLEKDPDDRWQTARDLVGELKWAAESRAGAPVVEAPARLSSARPGWIAAALLAAVLAAVSVLLVFHFREEPTAIGSPLRFTFLPPPGVTMPFSLSITSGLTTPIAVSPNGTHLAFIGASEGSPQLFIRDLESQETKRIDGTVPAGSMFWSPDGRRLGYVISGKLSILDLASNEKTSTGIPAFGGTWAPNGDMIVETDAGLARIRAEGGPTTLITRLDASRSDFRHMFPIVLPDGRHFLFQNFANRADTTGIYEGAFDSAQTTLILPNRGGFSFAQGFLIYLRQNSLVAHAFDWRKSKLVGEPRPILNTAGNNGFVSASPGLVAFVEGSARDRISLSWLDRKGNLLSRVAAPGAFSSPALSPDGRTLAVGRAEPPLKRDIWMIDLIRGTELQWTFDQADDLNPTWSPDGSRMAFTSERRGRREIFVNASSGVGEPALILDSETEANVEQWSPDGKLLLYNYRNPKATRQVWALPIDPLGKPYLVLSGPADIEQARLSPDGRFVAYRSFESGRAQVYVQTFPTGGGRWQISTTQGTQPQWRGDGKELFYLDGSKLMVAEVSASGQRFEPGIPQLLFEARFTTGGKNGYVVTKDGQTILGLILPEDATNRSITLLVNWLSRMQLPRQ
jgi:eukaryotic-like serine/threonine-protein kinase